MISHSSKFMSPSVEVCHIYFNVSFQVHVSVRDSHFDPPDISLQSSKQCYSYDYKPHFKVGRVNYLWKDLRDTKDIISWF